MIETKNLDSWFLMHAHMGEGDEEVVHIVSTSFGWGVKQPAMCGASLEGCQCISGPVHIGKRTCIACIKACGYDVDESTEGDVPSN